MLISNHVVQGALIGRACASPVRALVAGFVSHFVADSLPHWGDLPGEGGVHNPAFLRVAIPDGLSGLALIAFLLHHTEPARRPAVLAGIVGACAPDLDKPSKLAFGRSPWPTRMDDFHHAIQRESPRRMPQELLLTSAGAVLALALARRARRTRS